MLKFFKMLGKTLAVAFVVSLVYFTFFTKGNFGRHSVTINPNIYYAFQQIYHTCKSSDYSDRSRDCRIVVDIFNHCTRGQLRCSVPEYYQFLDNLGFDLPPFYMDE